MKYRMREKLASIGDDSWIEDEHGNKVYKVDGKAFRVRQTFELKDASGAEVAKIQERKLHVRDTIAIERGGKKIAEVHKRLVGTRDRLKVDLESGGTGRSRATSSITNTRSRAITATSPRSRGSGSECATPTVSTSPRTTTMRSSWRLRSRLRPSPRSLTGSAYELGDKSGALFCGIRMSE